MSTDGSLYGETWTDGQLIYNSSTVAGGLSKTKPAPPTSAVFVGVVINAHATNGVMFVRPMFFQTISQLSDVYINNLQDGQVLKWVAANSRWENKTP